MKEVTEQILAELKIQYNEAAEKCAEKLKNKANKNSMMYWDVYDKISDKMQWMYSQYDEIQALKKSNYEHSLQVEPLNTRISNSESHYSYVIRNTESLEKRARMLTEEQKRHVFAQKIKSYKSLNPETEEVKTKASKRSGTSTPVTIADEILEIRKIIAKKKQQLNDNDKPVIDSKVAKHLEIALKQLQQSTIAIKRIKHNPFKRASTSFPQYISENTKKLPLEWEQVEKEKVMIDNYIFVANRYLAFLEKELTLAYDYKKSIEDKIKADAETQAEKEFQEWRKKYEAQFNNIK